MAARRVLLALAVFAMCGCSAKPAVVDRSSDALDSGDMTLVSSCQSTPGAGLSLAGGVDSCRFSSGDKVAGAWTLVVPPPGKGQFVTGGTIDVYYRDLHKSFPVKSWATQVQFTDLFGPVTWSDSMDETVIEALATINWTDQNGLNQITKFRGIAVLLITAPGYDRLPFDSGNSIWGAKCWTQLTSAGRSAVECK